MRPHHQQTGLRIDHHAAVAVTRHDHFHHLAHFIPEVDIAGSADLAGVEGSHSIAVAAGVGAVADAASRVVVTGAFHLPGADPCIGLADTLQVEVVDVVTAGNHLIGQDLVAIAGTAEVITVTVAHRCEHFIEGDAAQAEGNGAAHVRVHHQVLPSTLHKAKKELTRRHILGRHIKARATAEAAAQRRDQRGLHGQRRHHLGGGLSLLEAVIQQLAALLIELRVTILEGLAGHKQTAQAQ